MILAAMIDSREPEWVQKLALGGAQTVVTALDHGDILATTDDGAMIAIERKTSSDFLASLQDERLWGQLAGIRALTPWAYLVITGPLSPVGGKVATARGVNGWSWASVQGAMLKVQELGIFTVYCEGDNDFEAAVLRLANRDRKSDLVIKPLRAPAILSEAERILTSLPGIGLERVKDILAYTGRPCWALQFLTDPKCLGNIPGIGAQTKRHIREALGLRDGEELSVVIVDENEQGIQERTTTWIPKH